MQKASACNIIFNCDSGISRRLLTVEKAIEQISKHKGNNPQHFKKIIYFWDQHKVLLWIETAVQKYYERKLFKELWEMLILGGDVF